MQPCAVWLPWKKRSPILFLVSLHWKRKRAHLNTRAHTVCQKKKLVFSWLWDVWLNTDESIWLVNYRNTKTQTRIQMHLCYTPQTTQPFPSTLKHLFLFLVRLVTPTPEQSTSLLIWVSWFHKGLKSWPDYCLEVAATKLQVSMELNELL